ncbi:unnamed protein product [Ilex paraguariensis]|uniref:Spindle and kinetochore-associated protein 1 n=1 Tax=Ilex paraguariensis TaxID=185542 RepID=A0ABC8UZP3_9AQUA
MEVKQAGSSLDFLISSFNTRIAELQELVIARNMYPASSVTDLSAVDAALKAMELQVHQIKHRLHEETQAIPKAKKLIEASLQQQKKLQSMSAFVPAYLPEKATALHQDINRGFNMLSETSKEDFAFGTLKLEEEPAVLPKVRNYFLCIDLMFAHAGHVQNSLESLLSKLFVS